MKRLIVIATALLASLQGLCQVGVGQWRDYHSYNTLYQVQATKERVYAAGQMGMFYYDRGDMTLNRWSKGMPLTDVGIARFAFDEASGYGVVAYHNSNVDLIYRDKVYNLSDIRRSEILGDKYIYSIRFYNGKAYLACGFGIVVTDLARKEIAETYYLGPEGGYAAIYDIAFTDSMIVAATDDGLKEAPLSQPYLHIEKNWRHGGLAGLQVQALAYGNGTLAAIATDPETGITALYRQTADEVFAKADEQEYRSLRWSHGMWVAACKEKVVLYRPDFTQLKEVTQCDWADMQALDADVDEENTLWVAHSWASLVSAGALGDGAVHGYRPECPDNGDNVYKLIPYKNRMLLCPGGKRTTYDNVYLAGDLLTFQNYTWKELDKGGHYFYDIVDAAVDTKDSNRVLAASWGGGIVEIRNNKVTAIYDDTATNGVLANYGDFRSIRTGGVAFDNEGNAWITNSLQNNGLVRLSHDGEWTALNTAGMVSGEIDKILWDSITGYKWFTGRANKIYVHDGESQMAYVDPNNGSKLETHSVNCLVQDHEGDLWLGTDKGLKVIRNGYQAFKNGGNGEQSPVTCSNILFSQNGITEYLMAYESITAIAVDGANRKWVGTAAGGLYLISSTGLEQLEHFTASNSPLFSDKIVTLAVQPQSGEVFIGTDKGLQSYRGTATYAEYYPEAKIKVFPNPVKPTYDGPISMKGFSRNALVHITDAAGHVVYATKATGGQAVWNGRNHDGARVASGVYFVLSSDQDGGMRTVGKVMIIR